MAKKVNKKKNNTNKNKVNNKANNKVNSNKTKKIVDTEVEILDDELFETKQQEFDFGDLELTSTLDTSFTTKKGSNKIKDEGLDKFDYVEENIVITKNNIGIIWVLIAIIILLVSFICYHFITFDHNKEKIVTKEKVVVDKNCLFLGDSITDFYDLDSYYGNKPVVNSGISGNVTNDILSNMKNRVYRYNPSKVFLLIGTNDVQRGIDNEDIVNNIEEIVEEIKKNRSSAKIYLESIYPVDEDEEAAGRRTNKNIKEINKELKKYCDKNDVKYIDMYSELVDHSDDKDKLK